MHPILARKRRLLPYLAASLPLGALLTVLLARPGAYSLAQAAAVAFPLAVVHAFLGLSAWYPCRSLPLSRAKAPVLLASHGGAALVTSAAWVLLGAGIGRLLEQVPALSGMADGYAAQVPPLFAVGVLLYLLSVALHYVLLAFEAAREAERREAQLRLLAREAELKALKSQVQPHFLFNCLNSISALAGSDPARAREMCLGLASFLRQSLAVGERASIPVGEELSLARSYLDVERIRFGKRLAVEESVEPSGEDCMVPPLLLQPLVENAVVHGIATLAEGGAVRLEASRSGNRLRIVIENPFDPDAPSRRSSGLGLKMVRDRLAALYGPDAMFAARRLEGRHLAVISIPARA
ncbi:MAG TPA: histidine kinase [Thermoanaerobaculia bacterium]|nr:histidine kinase [Thermoanaerobaculia bacterium]